MSEPMTTDEIKLTEKITIKGASYINFHLV